MLLVISVILSNKRNYHLPIAFLVLLANLNFYILIFGVHCLSLLFITINFYKFVWIVLLKSKHEVSQHVKNFITLIDTQFHITSQTIRTYNGPEFLLNSFYAYNGIFNHKSCVETPQHNGRVERNTNIY